MDINWKLIIDNWKFFTKGMFFKDTEQEKLITILALEITHDIFKISFITFLIFALLELRRPGFVVNYLNMNMLLGLVLVSGLVSLFLKNNKNI